MIGEPTIPLNRPESGQQESSSEHEREIIAEEQARAEAAVTDGWELYGWGGDEEMGDSDPVLHKRGADGHFEETIELDLSHGWPTDESLEVVRQRFNIPLSTGPGEDPLHRTELFLDHIDWLQDPTPREPTQRDEVEEDQQGTPEPELTDSDVSAEVTEPAESSHPTDKYDDEADAFLARNQHKL